MQKASEIFRGSPLFAFERSDFPEIGEEEPWLLHVAYADWTSGHNHVMHRHEDRAEVFILLHGSGLYTVGGRMYNISAGDIVLCDRLVMHDEFPAKSELYDTLTLGIANLHLPDQGEGDLVGAGRSPVFRRSDGTEQIRNYALDILRVAASGSGEGNMFCHYMTRAILELIGIMVREAGQPEEGDDASESRAARLCREVENYLIEHFMEDITLEDTARRFFVSPWYLSHVFKEETTYNFKQYLLRLRLGEAQMRLTISDDSIAHIAMCCGFHDPAYFSRLFTGHIGVSPLKYRKMRSAEGRN